MSDLLKMQQRDQCDWSGRIKEEKQWPPEANRAPDSMSYCRMDKYISGLPGTIQIYTYCLDTVLFSQMSWWGRET